MILFFGMPFVAVALIIAAVLVAVKSLRGAVSWSRIRQGLCRAVGTAVVCVLIVAMLHRGDSRYQPVSLPASAVVADEPRAEELPTSGDPFRPDSPTEIPRAAPTGDSDSTAIDGADDETMVLFLSRKDLRELLSGDGADGSATLDELHRFYAMVPLSTSGPQAVPPVLREALSPVALRQVLQPDNIKLLAGVLLEVLERRDGTASSAADSSHAASQPLLAASAVAAELDDVFVPATESEYRPAMWVEQPGVGQVVVESEFLEASTPAEEALRDSVLEALHQDVDRAVRRTLGPKVDWQALIRLSATDEAIRRCIISTDKRTEVIETAEGAKSMQKTYALVEFPETMTQQILRDVESELRINRLLGLCVGVALLWVMAILFSAACRATQHGPLFRKLAAFPLLALLLLPCLLAFTFVLGAMISGATFEFKSEQDRHSCLVDDTLTEDAAY